MTIRNLKKLYFVAKSLIINNKNEFLILKRTNYKKNNTNNLWDLPGGNIDIYEDINDALVREVHEETKITINTKDILSINSGKHPKEEAQVIFVLFRTKDFDIEDKITLSKEHSDFKWISVKEMGKFQFYLSQERLDKIKGYLSKLE